MTDSVSRMAWRSAILTARCEATLIAELGEIGDRLHHADDFGGDLLVELHIALEIGHDRTRQRFRLDGSGVGVGERHRGRFVVFGPVGIFLHARALEAFHQHLHGAVGQFEQLQDAGKRAGLVDRIGRRIIVRRVLLRRQHDQRVVLHDLFERADRFLAADEQRHDHVRENDDVAERQHRVGVAFAVNDGWPGFWGRHGLFLLLCPLARSPPFCATATRCRDVPGRLAALGRFPGSFDSANLTQDFRRRQH